MTEIEKTVAVAINELVAADLEFVGDSVGVAVVGQRALWRIERLIGKLKLRLAEIEDAVGVAVEPEIHTHEARIEQSVFIAIE